MNELIVQSETSSCIFTLRDNKVIMGLRKIGFLS